MQTQRREGFVKRLIKKSSNIRHFHHHRASKNTVTFHFKLSKPVEDYPGEVILISGSIPELGNGSLENAARMYFEDTPQGRVWKYDLVVPVKELEHARMDIAGTYEGNPHGNFFTYNYVVKKPEEKGMPAIEKFEAVPRRGVPKSSLLSTNSLGEQAFLNDYTIEHTWSASSAPNSVIISKKDLSSNDSLGSKAEITPVMKGKATTADSSPMSPSRPRATTITTDAIPRLHEVTSSKAVERSVSFNMISERDQEVLDQLKAQLDDKDAKKKGMFSWYKNLKGKDQAEQVSPEIKSKNVYSPETERQQRYIREAAQQAMPTVLANEEEPITIVIEDPLPALPQESEAPVVRSLSPEERKAEEKKIIEKQIGLRRSYDSYQKRSMSEEATETIKTNENFVVPEMVRIEDVEPVAFVAPQLVSSDHERLEHDPLMNAVDPELKEEKFDFNTSIEELEQRVISNLKEAELKRSFSEEAVLPEVPKELDTTSSMQPPMSMEDSLSKFSATPESDEISEDVLLDRIEESTPLLAPADSQLQDIEDSEISGITRSGVIEFSDYAEEPSEVSEAKSLPASFNAESEAPTQTSSWASSIGIDAVLSGKMYRIGQELKQKIFGESGWSNFLQSHKDLQSSIRSFEPVDPVVSGKLHNVHRELTSKVAGKSVEDRNDWLSSRRASSIPTQSVDPIISGKLHIVHRELLSKVAGKSTEARNEWLSSRRNSTMPSSELVDPVISGKMHRVHMQLKQKLPESGRLVDFFGFVPRAIPFNGINPITSGKMHKVHQEITSKIPAISAIRVTPSIWNSGVPEITIKDESIKSMSVFEEQMEKELIHRKVNKQEEDESFSPVTIAGKVSTKDLKTVGFHTVRNDFTPISHSESMIASETMTSPLSVQLFNQSPSGFLIMFSIFVWFLLYSIYFPESMLAEMSPTSSTEVVRAPNKEL